MARATIHAGICGFATHVQATPTDDPRRVTLVVESECPAIQRLAEALPGEVDPFREFSFRREPPLVLELGAAHCDHAACPVPVGIVKAVEVAAGLALPADVTITVTNVDDG